MPVSVMTSVAQHGAVREHTYELETLPPLPARRLDRRVGDGVPFIRKAHTGAYFLALRRYAARTIAHINTNLGDDAAIAIGLWDTASRFWCDACRRSGVPYELFAYGAELLAPLYGRLPEWRRRDFVSAAHVIACSHATADLAMHRFRAAGQSCRGVSIGGPASGCRGDPQRNGGSPPDASTPRWSDDAQRRPSRAAKRIRSRAPQPGRLDH